MWFALMYAPAPTSKAAANAMRKLMNMFISFPRPSRLLELDLSFQLPLAEALVVAAHLVEEFGNVVEHVEQAHRGKASSLEHRPLRPRARAGALWSVPCRGSAERLRAQAEALRRVPRL